MEQFHILHFEDNSEVASKVEEALHSPLYAIDRFQNDQLTLEELSQYDLLLLDEAYAELAHPLWHQLMSPPRVILTGNSEKSLEKKIYLFNSQTYLLKTSEEYITQMQVAINELLHEENFMQTGTALQQYTRDLQLLYKTGQNLNALHDLQAIIERLLDIATEIAQATGGSIWLWDVESNDYLICRAQLEVESTLENPLVGTRLVAGKGVAGWVAEHGESVIVNKLANQTQFANNLVMHHDLQTDSLLAVPLIIRDTVLGVLEVVNKRSGDFTPRDQHLVEALGDSAALALDNARLMTKLRRGSIELQTRNEELDAFAHTVAHNLQAKVGHLIGFAELLAENWPELPADEIALYLATIIKSGHKMQDIIDELLLLAQLRDADVTLKPLDMGAIVQEACDRLDTDIVEAKAVVRVPDSWPIAWGYAPWLEEVWVNYLSNGLKYGGDLPVLQLGYTELEKDMVAFWVEDQGIGMTSEEQQSLFTPFTRLNQLDVDGYGLGLSIVQRIIKRLGGGVEVQSQPGEGSRFIFLLPTKNIHTLPPEERLL